MTARAGNPGKVPLLPAGVGAGLRRFAIESTGLGLAVLAFLALAALASHDSADPSWNTATGAAPANWVGAAGAWAADAGLQTLGLAALLPAFLMFVWGWRLWRDHRLPRARLRLAADRKSVV